MKLTAGIPLSVVGGPTKPVVTFLQLVVGQRQTLHGYSAIGGDAEFMTTSDRQCLLQ